MLTKINILIYTNRKSFRNSFNKEVFTFLIVLSIFMSSCFNSSDKEEVIEFRKVGKNLIRTFIDENGLKHINYYNLDTVKFGKELIYKENQLVEQIFWDNDRRVGSSTFFINGLPNYYICFDSFGDTIFSRSFNGQKILQEKGEILSHGFLDLKDKKCNDIFDYNRFVPQPPYCSINYESFIIDLNNNDTIYPFRKETKYNWIFTDYFA